MSNSDSHNIVPLFLTEDKKIEIRKELDDIENNQMPEIRARLAKAYEDGDIPENNPFITAHEDLQMAMKRRNELREILMRTKLFKHTRAEEIIGLGSKVKVRVDSKIEKEITIVSPEEVNTLEGKLSINSPYGKALKGKRIGDMVIVKTPSGDKRVEIVS